ncbi:hypothetical protein BBK82_28635 [Lentzea guizhouensis]|uniref:AAA+ ATPase domain-containing protein n=1 Tax=Lentzea guizhouensis TaxID=1586287 RepID=A0A1B2HNY9_9PSEU|nr:restriction endonuclease [Lentzea guizhouensis]ANZ39426.1 hypothetical protein BBK82_28635 [Lentzea guizhouensis]
MDSFDLRRLTDHDFELVCADLLSDVLGVPLEVFPAGRDGGVDLRHDSLVVQCKHWAGSGRAALVKQLVRDELPKVRKLGVERYVVATSASLTVADKATLVAAFRPFLASGDIFGAEQLVELLRSRPEVVRRHFRLWLSSTAVLQTLLSADIVRRSAWLADDLAEVAKTFVPHAGFESARETVEATRVCVITGIPGIGKTTIAKMLALWLADDGYEIVEVSEDAGEIARLWDASARQVFVYDDFLGSTTLESFRKNEDHRLLAAMRRIAATPGKALIMTTRGYILEQARQRHRVLGEADLDPLTSVVELSDLTPEIRAQILYNHVHASAMPVEEKRRFADPEVWRPIVRHRNFNPRLIERTLALAEPGEMIANLDNPRRIWETIFENELTDAAVHLMEIVFTLPWSVEHVQAAWTSYRQELSLPSDSRTFRQALRILDGTMVVVGIAVQSHNPSITDYLRYHLSSGRADLRALITSFTDEDQIVTLTDSAVWEGGDRLLEALRKLADVVVPAVIGSGFSWEEDERIIWLIETAKALQSDEVMAHAAELVVQHPPTFDPVDGDLPTLMALAALMTTTPGFPQRVASAFAEKLSHDLLTDFLASDTREWWLLYKRLSRLHEALTHEGREEALEFLLTAGEEELTALAAADEIPLVWKPEVEHLLAFMAEHDRYGPADAFDVVSTRIQSLETPKQQISDTPAMRRQIRQFHRDQHPGEERIPGLMRTLADLD